jgi:hypothetical protein
MTTPEATWSFRVTAVCLDAQPVTAPSGHHNSPAWIEDDFDPDAR